MLNLSFWEYNSWFSNLDIVIAGGGITGLSTAIFLKQKEPGLRILVLEKGILPHGASTRNAGFACFGSPTEIISDLKAQGGDHTVELIAKRLNGLQLLRDLLGDKTIGYRQDGGYEIFTDENAYAEAHERLKLINKLLKPVTGDETFRVRDDLIKKFGLKCRHIIATESEGQIDTGMMMQALYRKAVLAGVHILYGLSVEAFSDQAAGVALMLNNNHEINCRRFIVATNGFASKLLRLDQVKPARAQVLITEPVEGLAFRGNFHYDEGFYYFRNVENRVLFGGGRNLDIAGEETTSTEVTPNIQDRLNAMLEEIILPGKKPVIAMRWAGIMGVGREKSPIIRNVSPHVTCCVRLGGMGVALGTQVGRDTASLVLS